MSSMPPALSGLVCQPRGRSSTSAGLPSCGTRSSLACAGSAAKTQNSRSRARPISRSFPRKRESSATCPWLPAFAGTSGENRIALKPIMLSSASSPVSFASLGRLSIGGGAHQAGPSLQRGDIAGHVLAHRFDIDAVMGALQQRQHAEERLFRHQRTVAPRAALRSAPALTRAPASRLAAQRPELEEVAGEAEAGVVWFHAEVLSRQSDVSSFRSCPRKRASRFGSPL